jgi:hypothetical protein
MATYLARTCPRCNGYLGIVLREAGRNVPIRAVNGHCFTCDYRLAWDLSSKVNGLPHSSLSGGNMLDPQKHLNVKNY